MDGGRIRVEPDDLLEANQFVSDDMELKSSDNVINDPSSQTIGKVAVGRNTTIKSNTRIKGPSVIGENCEIGPNVYIGPYTSIGNNSRILSGEVEGSIIMENTTIDCNRRIVDSIIGRHSRLESGQNIFPSGLRLVVGERTFCCI